MSKLYFFLMLMSMSLQTDLLYAHDLAQDPPEIDITIDLKLYPNPTVDLVNIQVSNLNAGSFELRNMIGKKLETGTISQQVTTINMQDYQNGLYILSIYDDIGNRLASKKVLKK